MVVENMGFSPSLVCWGYFAFGVILVFFSLLPVDPYFVS
jgi:hypothetical protein